MQILKELSKVLDLANHFCSDSCLFLYSRLLNYQIVALFAWLISHQPVLLFSHNKPVTSNQPAVLFSQNKPAPAHQPTEQALYISQLYTSLEWRK
jgi:hypothetical protein